MVELDDEKVNAFAYAIKHIYWYQMYIDDLPIWGKVGEHGDNNDYHIYTHKKLEIAYNNDRIVDIKLTTDNKQPLVSGHKLKFTYEVNFYPSAVNFRDRFNKYLDPTFFQHRVNLSSHSVCDVPRLMSCVYILNHWTTDPLVQYFQQFYDGHLFGGPCIDDFVANAAQGLPALQQGRGDGRHGTRPRRRIRLEASAWRCIPIAHT